jgi:5-methylcytosine-specific restriction endonuclease McrA
VSKKKRLRVELNRVTKVAQAYGMKGNDGYKAIAEAIARKHHLIIPHKREDAKALIAAQPEYGLPVTHKLRRQRKNNFAATDAFLESYEWRRVRMVVLKRDGARCACCGATPSDGVKMNVDHIKPRKNFPELALDPQNLQVLCEVCNHGKGNWDQTDWRQGEPANDSQEQQHLRSIMEGTWAKRTVG